MRCPGCGSEWGAVNQNSACPGCGAKVQTQQEKDLQEKHAEIMQWHDGWETDTQDAQELAQTCLEYYHGKQWSEDDLSELRDRNQPPIVKNRTAKKINFLLGDEIRSRTDPKALPRTLKHDQDVNAMTDALRYVGDNNNFDQITSRIWRDVLIPGWAAAVVEDEIKAVTDPVASQTNVEPLPGLPGMAVEQTNVDIEQKEVEIKVRRVSWDRFWWDIRSREPDFSDASYVGIDTWWHPEEARTFYGKRPDQAENWEEVLEDSLNDSTGQTETLDDKPRWVQGQGSKKRVRVSECYYKQADPQTNQIHWQVCHATRLGFVVPPRPTGHLDEDKVNICPVVAMSAFVDDDDGSRYGLVRNMLSPQDELNKRSSKMLHLLSVDRITAEEKAVLDVDETRQERAKPDGVTIVQRGALAQKRIIFEKGLDVAQAHHAMLQESKQDLDQIGPEIPQIGSVAGGASGRALQQRQMIGSLEIAPLHDQLSTFKREIFKRVWWRIKAVWTAEKWFRVRDDDEKTGYRFVGINRRLTKGQRFAELLEKEVPPESALEAVGLSPTMLQQITQQMVVIAQQQGQQIDPQQAQRLALEGVMKTQAMSEMVTANDVAQLGIDVILEESPDVSIIQHEEVQELSKVLQSVLTSGEGQRDPQLVKQILTMIVEAGQLRTKKKLLQILQQPPDPQQAQIQQAQQQMQMQQMQLSLQQIQAAIQNLGSQTQLNQARAAGEAADAQATQVLTPAEVELKQAQALKAAADAGDKAGGAPFQ